MNISNYSVLNDSASNRDYFIYIHPLKENFKFVKIPRNFVIKIQSAIVKSLSLNSIQELRDRYEGVAYFDNNLRKVGSNYCVEHLLNNCKFNNYEIDLKSNLNIIEYNDTLYEIITFRFGQIPKIDIKRNNLDKIIVMQRDTNYFYLCGILPYKLINEESSSIMNDTTIYFKDFTKLIYPENI